MYYIRLDVNENRNNTSMRLCTYTLDRYIYSSTTKFSTSPGGREIKEKVQREINLE